MKTKAELIGEIKDALSSGVLQPADLRMLLDRSHSREIQGRKLPVSSAFYYIAGILLFAVLLSVVFQTSGKEFYFLHLSLTTGAGLFMWAIVVLLQRQTTNESDTTEGLKSSLLITGVLAVLAGAFVMTFHQMQNSSDGSMFNLTFAIFLALAAFFHAAADVVIKNVVLMSMSILLSILTLGFIAAQLLSDAQAGVDAWVLTTIAIALGLAVETRLLARSVYGKRLEPSMFDGLAIWVALLAAYFANFGEFGAFWLLALALAVLGMFYLSVVKQKRYFLGTAAFFLVLTLVTISFKYFSDFGVTVSLFFSLVAVLGSAYLTSVLNKRYFK